jgi:hypothetical protein
MVIYASDTPFDPKVLWNAVPDVVTGEGVSRLATQASRVLIDLAEGAPSAAIRFFLAVRNEPPHQSVVHTTLVPPERLKRYTDREPGVILTDQFCPVDNLMAEVFRARNRDR